MGPKQKLRNEEVYYLGDVKYQFIDSLVVNEHGVHVKQIPTGQGVIGRVLKLVVGDKMVKRDAFKTVADELYDVWVYGMNIYPMMKLNIKVKIERIYDRKKVICFRSLYKRQLSGKVTDSFIVDVHEFNNMMLTGFDIRASDKNYLKRLEDTYGLIMGDLEEKLYMDNCKSKACDCKWEAKIANSMEEEEFLSRVKMVRLQAAKAKEGIKQRRVARSYQLLEQCQKHNGPITPLNIDKLLDTLSEEEIHTEVKYLKATVASDLKLKRRVTNSITKKYTYENYPIAQLRLSIRNVVKPTTICNNASISEIIMDTI